MFIIYYFKIQEEYETNFAVIVNSLYVNSV